MNDNIRHLMNQTPPLEQQSIDACLAEISASLAKYNCHLIYQEVRHNGQIVNGQFVVQKKPS